MTLLATAAVGICGCGDEGPAGPASTGSASTGARQPASAPARPQASRTPVAAFAPLVRLHPRERWFPISAQRFISNSGLEWGGGLCQLERDVTASAASRERSPDPVPRLVVARLARPPGYRVHALRADCSGPRGRVYSTTMHTSPFADGPRPAGLRPGEGFALDILTAAQPGQRRRGDDGALAGVPAYYARERMRVARGPGIRLSYWLLFGHGARARPSRPGQLVHHEGDWERIDVVVRSVGGKGGRPIRYAPFAVRYHAEGRVLARAWRDVELSHGTHPVVDLTAEAHTPGPPRSCDDCIEWPTWRDLRDVRRQAWFGYGGAWGDTDRPPLAASPAGPSPYVLDPDPAGRN